LADYAREYEKIRAVGADLAAISVDRIDQASGMKRDLNLPFHVLCDTERNAITAWGLVNHREGDIAFPASFIIDCELHVRWSAAESLASRAVPSGVAAAVIDLATNRPTSGEVRKHTIWPGAMFLRAAMNTLARGFKSR
jgi:peroxiredoxin